MYKQDSRSQQTTLLSPQYVVCTSFLRKTRVDLFNINTHHCSSKSRASCRLHWLQYIQPTALKLKLTLFSDKQDLDLLKCFFHLVELYHTILRDKRLREKATETRMFQQFLLLCNEIPLVKSKYTVFLNANICIFVCKFTFIVIHFFNCCHPKKLINWSSTFFKSLWGKYTQFSGINYQNRGESESEY